MPTRLAHILETQNRRCDSCTLGDNVTVPTLFVYHTERESPSGITSIRTRESMLLPGQHVFCQLLRARVNAGGQCDQHQVFSAITTAR
jgi:hypothetical protein